MPPEVVILSQREHPMDKEVLLTSVLDFISLEAFAWWRRLITIAWGNDIILPLCSKATMPDSINVPAQLFDLVMGQMPFMARSHLILPHPQGGSGGTCSSEEGLSPACWITWLLHSCSVSESRTSSGQRGLSNLFPPREVCQAGPTSSGAAE